MSSVLFKGATPITGESGADPDHQCTEEGGAHAAISMGTGRSQERASSLDRTPSMVAFGLRARQSGVMGGLMGDLL